MLEEQMSGQTPTQLRDNRRGVAREARAQPFTRMSTCQFNTNATQRQERRFHRAHLHD